ncbi:TIGR03546 family protein [Gynuella sunshinyii]|uniref:DUF2062 domain-containing protein n=1 Tax=Gynuella sunshinyii YC6258 TaxID=1445510 RepID=A0A0C5VR40_9GAMM|nr:TIGR03546 family protein [Gynuella sunshinyii]AJQ96706.1 hypothetical protein YC6258_04674 [Gynuella sunshinyii YC6258]
MINTILDFIKALNSNAGPWSIAFAIGLGMIMGLTPFWTFHNLLILLLALVLRTHLASFWLSVAFFSGIAYLADQSMLQVGENVLTHGSLQPLWTSLYQSDFWRFTRFNNTLVMGSLVTALIAFVPVVVAIRILVVQYRLHALAWVNKLRVIQLIKASKLFAAYKRISE